MKFKISYNKGVLTTESTDLKQLKVEKQQGSMVVKALADEWNGGFISLKNKKDEKNSLKKGQFVVQIVPKKCYDKSQWDLVYFCTGQIKLREMTANEKAKY